MPYLHLSLSGRPSPDLVREVAEKLTTLTEELLGKKRELTAVAVSTLPAENWFIGGNPIAKDSLTTFYLDIKVTEGTNTKNEKAAYVGAVFSAMSVICGELASASYVVIHEVAADAWGYSGQTQEFRYIKGKAL
ncbi:4-oxalocrotonate tautomerase family protein [Pantoea stewartii]|uniref:tautomerase family protein n=1 Tax=Pantoea stewartii TaxID=66269 RepID=UPI00345B698B